MENPAPVTPDPTVSIDSPPPLRSRRRGDVAALARVVKAFPSTSSASVQRKRVMVAEFCRLLGGEFSAPAPDPSSDLSPRHRQTLQRLLAGDSEKQIAVRFGVSPHTVHVYVKALYRRFDVSSRGELLARFIHAPALRDAVVASPE